MTDFYPMTQVDDEDDILALIGSNRFEEEDDTRTETGSPNNGEGPSRFLFPFFSDMQKMTEQEYEELQDKMQAFSYTRFSKKFRYLKEQKAKEIRKDIELYKREASRFRMISPETMTKFAEARLGFSKIQDVINIYTSLMHRIVLPGDFPNSASNYAQYPGIINFAKEITGPDEIEPRYIFVDLEQLPHQDQVP